MTVALDMIPILSVDYHRDGHRRNMESLSQCVSGPPKRMQSPYSNDLSLIEFRHGMLGTWHGAAWKFTFLRGISHVVGVGTKKEMIGIYAERFVARMKHTGSMIAGTFRNLSFERLIGGTMGRQTLSAHLDASILICAAPARLGPNPATIISWHRTCANAFRKRHSALGVLGNHVCSVSPKIVISNCIFGGVN